MPFYHAPLLAKNFTPREVHPREFGKTNSRCTLRLQIQKTPKPKCWSGGHSAMKSFSSMRWSANAKGSDFTHTIMRAAVVTRSSCGNCKRFVNVVTS